MKEADLYLQVNKRLEYPDVVRIYHYENLGAIGTALASPEYNAIIKDVDATFPSVRFLWQHGYMLLKSFRNEPSFRQDNAETMIENAPVMLLESYQLSPEEEKDYYAWLTRWGYEVYIPILMKLKGIKGYDCYRWAGIKPTLNIKSAIFPQHLSILYFESIEAYEDYEKSPEVVALRRAVSYDFLKGLSPRWHAQYQLRRSVRK